MKLMLVIGTRPEAIKLLPIYMACKTKNLPVAICCTGQHQEMLSPIYSLWGIHPEYELGIMAVGQTLNDVGQKMFAKFPGILAAYGPDIVMVQGDTSTALYAAQVAFNSKIKISHLEAGLRTYNLKSPWPEEANRQLISRIADQHFAPTIGAADSLKKEYIDVKKIHVVGNTVIDSLLYTVKKIDQKPALQEEICALLPSIDPNKKLVIVTGHRRENFDGGLQAVCRVLCKLASRDDVQIIYPVHLNPVVQEIVNESLVGQPNIQLIAPLDYVAFVYLMKQAYLIITDSGGVQEEAPSLGVPVLVTRDTTERLEGISAGTAKLVGIEEDSIMSAATELLNDVSQHASMAKASNPYGDGFSSKRIIDILYNQQTINLFAQGSDVETQEEALYGVNG